MAEAAVTSKGQITIPAEIRKQMNLGPQDKVVFTLLPNGTTVMARKESLSDIIGKFHYIDKETSRDQKHEDSLRCLR